MSAQTPRALRSASTISRTAPWPPRRGGHARRPRLTSGTALATAIGSPTRRSTGRSARSSPTKAASSQPMPAPRAALRQGRRASRDRGPGAAPPPAARRPAARSPRSSARSARRTGSPAVRRSSNPSPSWMSKRLSSTRSPAIGPIKTPLSVSTPSTSSAEQIRTAGGSEPRQSPWARAQRSSVRSSSSGQLVEGPLGGGVAQRAGGIRDGSRGRTRRRPRRRRPRGAAG